MVASIDCYYKRWLVCLFHLVIRTGHKYEQNSNHTQETNAGGLLEPGFYISVG